MVIPFKWNLFSSTFTRYYLFTVDLRFNEVPRDWGSLFVISRVCYIESLSEICNFCWIWLWRLWRIKGLTIVEATECEKVGRVKDKNNVVMLGAPWPCIICCCCCCSFLVMEWIKETFLLVSKTHRFPPVLKNFCLFFPVFVPAENVPRSPT